MSRTASGAKTLDGMYYTDQSIYNAETERIFLKHWLYVCRSSDIRDAGQYVLHDVEAESVIVLRDPRGAVRAFHNVCRHRGTRLCADPTGTFSKSIQCPYHAWTYDLDGCLIGAPQMDDVTGFDRADYPLHAVAAGEVGGNVFVNFATDPRPLEEVFAPLEEKFSRWDTTQLLVAHRIVYDVAANWKLIFQNYSECYHCPSLHPILNRLTPYRDSANDLTEGSFLGGPMMLSEGHASMTMSGRACACRLPHLHDDETRLVYYYTIFPNMLLSLFPDYALVHRVDRLATNRTRIVCDWLFHRTEMARADFDPTEAIEFWNLTNSQDWEISERSQRGVASRAYQPGPYSNLESVIAIWDREYLKAVRHEP